MRALLDMIGVGALVVSSAHAARLDLALTSAGSGKDALRLDVLWTMSRTDTAAQDIDSLNVRFNVWYAMPDHGTLTVAGLTTLPGWTTNGSSGYIGAFSEDLFLAVDDVSGEGVPGNGSEFSTVLASVFLLVEGNVAGSEITFRHNGPNDPLPAAYNGAVNWQLRWQYEVNGPLQFDIGAGNPGDAPPSWPYHGYETTAPIIVPPEPGSLGLLALGALALLRFRR